MRAGRLILRASYPPLKGRTENADIARVQPNRDGTAAVVHGALVVTPPSGEGRRAVVRAETGIELSVPGAAAGQGPVEVLAAGDVAITLAVEEPHVDVHVEVSRDELLATMRVERIPGARFRLEDQPANQSIELRRLVVERVPCVEPTLDDLAAQLQVHGVVVGLVPDALDRLVRGGFGPEAVAKGTGPIPPRDGVVTLHGLAETGERFVRAGTMLAKVAEPLPGTDGMTVHGRRIDVGYPSPAELDVGDGATVESDGRVVATIDGHASIVDRIIIVTPALIVDGDVGSASGEITSPGSIEVSGSIEAGSLLRAKRSIRVGDAVRRATVEAGGSLEIGGAAFDATLRAGHTWAALNRLLEVTSPLSRDVARVANGVGQLVAATRQAGRTMHPVRALAMVLERVEPELERRIKAALAEADRHRGAVPYEMLAALRAGQEELDAIRGGRSPIDNLSSVARTFEQQTARLEEMTAVRPRLTCTLLQKCHVDAFGTVAITGKGVVDSDLRVVGTLEVSAPEALVRGGRIDLDGSAVLPELAPGAGAGLTIVLAPGSSLVASLVHPGVIFQLPTGTQRQETLQSDVRVSAPAAAAA
jgi:hypothetical protein